MNLFLFGTKTNILYPHRLAYFFNESGLKAPKMRPFRRIESFAINPKCYNRRQVAQKAIIDKI